MFYDEKYVQRIKEEYPVGTRIVLDRMGDDPRPIESGTKGTVRVVDDAGTVHCDFDNGRRLGLVPEVDIFHKELEQTQELTNEENAVISNSQIQKENETKKGEDKMEIVLYQINPDRDYQDFEFQNYEYVQRFGLDPYSYDRVWQGYINAENLHEVYSILNSDVKPLDYMGRSMSVSDVCEIKGTDGESKFYFVDSYGFKEIKFDADLTRDAKEREITVVACYPGKAAEVITIPNTLKAMQEFVSHGESHSMIEAVYPSSDPIAIICNEEGKLWNLPLNRAMYSDHGEMIDVIAGNFFVCGLGENDFTSIRGDLQEKYLEKFRHPEKFMKFGDQIMAFKIPEKKKQEEQGHKQHRHR